MWRIHLKRCFLKCFPWWLYPLICEWFSHKWFHTGFMCFGQRTLVAMLWVTWSKEIKFGRFWGDHPLIISVVLHTFYKPILFLTIKYVSETVLTFKTMFKSPFVNYIQDHWLEKTNILETLLVKWSKTNDGKWPY